MLPQTLPRRTPLQKMFPNGVPRPATPYENEGVSRPMLPRTRPPAPIQMSNGLPAQRPNNSATYGTGTPPQGVHYGNLLQYAGQVASGNALPQRRPFGITGDQQRHINASAMGLPATRPTPNPHEEFVQRARPPMPVQTENIRGTPVMGIPRWNRGFGEQIDGKDVKSKYYAGAQIPVKPGDATDGRRIQVDTRLSPTGGLVMRGLNADGTPLKILQDQNDPRFRAFMARVNAAKQANKDARVLNNAVRYGLPAHLPAVQAALARTLYAHRPIPVSTAADPLLMPATPGIPRRVPGTNDFKTVPKNSVPVRPYPDQPPVTTTFGG